MYGLNLCISLKITAERNVLNPTKFNNNIWEGFTKNILFWQIAVEDVIHSQKFFIGVCHLQQISNLKINLKTY